MLEDIGKLSGESECVRMKPLPKSKHFPGVLLSPWGAAVTPAGHRELQNSLGSRGTDHQE